MKKFNLKLTTRLVLSIIIPAGTLLAMAQYYIGLNSYNSTKESGIEYMDASSHEIASKVENYINSSFTAMEDIEDACITQMELKAPSREEMNRLLEKKITSNKNYLGIWVMCEPNLFDNKDASYKNNPLYVKTNGSYLVTYYKDNDALKNEICRTEQYQDNYYYIPKASKTNTLLEPYFYSYVGDTTHQYLITSVIRPIINNNVFIGVAGIDIELKILKNISSGFEFGKTGFATIITNSRNIVSHPNDNLISKSIFTQFDEDTTQISDAISNGKSYISYGKNADNKTVIRYFSPVNISGTKSPWSVMVEIPLSEVTEKATNLIKVMVLTNIISLGLFILLIIIISRTITKPIIGASNFVQKISEGDLTEKIVYDRSDEIGQMSKNLQKMADKLHNVVSDIVSNAQNISAAGTELNVASQQLSEGASEQAASTEEVSSSMEEMVSNINQNADNAQQTEQIALRASSDIEEGSKAVLATLDSMKKIAEKISIIGVIAEKTDLLAINAAIEAARAGEHGKGFAVVATEVRKLAERSQIAAKEIDELSKNSVRIADESGNVLRKIIPDIKRTALLVQEISSASMEQNSGASQINNAIMQLNSVTQRNATASEEISSSAEELVNQADVLKDIVSFFKTGNNQSDLKHINQKYSGNLESSTSHEFEY